MRRIKRRLFTSVSVLSLLLCLVAIAVWVNGGEWHRFDDIGSRDYILRISPAIGGFEYRVGMSECCSNTQVDITLPCWLPALATSLLPVIWVIFTFRMRDREMDCLNSCLNCGYDLRATTDRCPECGAKISSQRTFGALSSREKS